jgi:hypothetical protein
VSTADLAAPVDEPLPVPIEDPIERRYAVREVRVCLHQARFRGRVVPAYNSQCAICTLNEGRLLDAAHIVGDLEVTGEAVVRPLSTRVVRGECRRVPVGTGVAGAPSVLRRYGRTGR